MYSKDIFCPSDKKAFQTAFSRMQSAYHLCALPPPTAKVVLVAGTNGKGSFCRSLEVIALAHGLKVGLYSSPHLLSIAERIRIQGQSIPLDRLEETLQARAALFDACKLSFFERMTLAAFELFGQCPLDLYILEIGLGGKWDAVNVMHPDLSVITTIDYDHTHILGQSREAIAREKAGIFRRQGQALIMEPDPPHTLTEAIRTLGLQAAYFGKDWNYQHRGSDWYYHHSEGTRYGPLAVPQLPLLSVSAAFYAYQQLGWTIDPSLLEQMMPFFTLPGRMQCLYQLPTVIADVAHNPQSFQYLLEQLVKGKKVRVDIICAMLRDKEIEKALKPASQLAPNVRWILPKIEHDRACDPQRLAQALVGQWVERCPDVPQAIDYSFKSLPSDGLMVISGSFVTVGQALSYFGSDAQPERITAELLRSTPAR